MLFKALLDIIKDFFIKVFNNADKIQALVVTLSIIIGFSWFISLPRLNIAQEIVSRKIDDNRIWLNVAIKIKNDGEKAMYVNDGFVRLQLIKPLDERMLDKVKCNQSLVVEEDGVVDWSTIAEREIKEKNIIEPKETSTYFVEFVFPSRYRGIPIETVKVYSFINNRYRRSSRDEIRQKQDLIGWEAQTIYDIKQ